MDGRGHNLGSWTLAVLTLAVVLSWAPTEVRAEDSPLVCAANGGEVTCSVDLRRAFDAPLKKRLLSGFSNTLVYRLYIRRASDSEPVALTAWRKLQVYELWDEHHLVYEGDGEQQRTVVSDADVVDRLAVYARIVAAGQLPPGAYFADLIVEVNPLGKSEEAEIRSWIARSRGGHRTFAAGDRSFLGTFVSLFINIRPGSAQRSFRYQTQAFTVGLEP